LKNWFFLKVAAEEVGERREQKYQFLFCFYNNIYLKNIHVDAYVEKVLN
jgi:hypothetical protein